MTHENRLSRETSPYLLQHKSNPVDWWPWGPEALEEARSTGKPILLSVGYAACHWCHVMAHESFEDEATARTMNALFINVKVDREERPDIDQLYMSALQHLGQRGGWPLTMFLTPHGEPFWGGTYFPKESRHGKPAFVDVLNNVSRIFRDEPSNVERNRSVLMEKLKAAAKPSGRVTLGSEDLDRLAVQLLEMFDPVNGGLQGRSKFPQITPLEFLWRAGTRTGDPRFLAAVDLTLTQMCRGGICDLLGGGFSRYTVDERWLIPHFEKMLYDNAQILEMLALAYQRTRTDIFRDRARDIVSWLEREMTTAEGMFSSALDADCEGDEGGYYLWTAQEIVETLGAEEAAFFSTIYGVTPEGNFEGRNILNELDDAVVSAHDRARLERSRKALLAARQKRSAPRRDDKVLADWNALTIAALVNAAVALDEPSWIVLADGAFRQIVAHMSRDSRLGHAWRLGRLLFPGLASDHVAMIRAALTLYEVKGDRFYLQTALEWQSALDRHHADAETGGYILTADDATDVVMRLKSVTDDALPNINALAALNLVRLAFFTDDDAFRIKADRLFDGLLPIVNNEPLRSCALLNALDLRLNGAQIVICGEGEGADRLNAAALELPCFERMVLRVRDAEALPPSHSARAKAQTVKAAAAHVCIGEQCSMPLLTVPALKGALAQTNR